MQKWKGMKFIVLLLSIYILIFPAYSIAQTVLYVATSGNDSTGNGSIESPFQTIQYAIDTATNGDAIIVMEGKYVGSGNINLDFIGKSIIVQSRNPEDVTCLQNTIIDANGQGVIVKFVHDEGPKSIFEGFTLFAGDTSRKIVRGVPGFFEFSIEAKPTMRQLNIGGERFNIGGERSQASLMEPSLLTTTPDNRRVWNGNNPFHQPAATTDYYGSGDVDNDGTLTAQDVYLAQAMINGTQSHNHRADVNGNCTVDTEDLSLINDALSGGILPAWWNRLTDKTDRNVWVSRFLTIDQTNLHPYSYCFFQCGTFAVQTFIHGAFYRDDLYSTYYDGGQTMFNLPIYTVSVNSESFGHNINAILVGDDPLNFADWMFIEPQSDYDVYPGSWDMPYNTTVRIQSMSQIFAGGYNGDDKVVFTVTETGETLNSFDPSLQLSRPTPETNPPNNLPDLWNPRFISGSNQATILFERYREDMSCMTDIHIANSQLSDPPIASALTGSSQYSRLLDVAKGNDGTIHLLWKGKANYVPGVFYGILNTDTREVTGIERISSLDVHQIRMGRLIVTANNDIHAFWFTLTSNSNCSVESGIYWNHKTESGWQAEQNLKPGADSFGSGMERDIARYFFDVTLVNDEDIVLVWAEYALGSSGTASGILSQRQYDGNWTPQNDIEAGNVLGVKLSRDSTGVLHLVYWLRGDEWNDVWGNLMHRTSVDGVTWSAPAAIDSGGNAGCPWMVKDNQRIYLVWERNLGSQVIPVWNTYMNGVWGSAQSLSIKSGTDAWYPTAEPLSNGVGIAWSSRSADRVAIETTIISAPENSVVNPAIYLLLLE